MKCKGTLNATGKHHDPAEMNVVETLEPAKRWRCPKCGTVIEKEEA